MNIINNIIDWLFNEEKFKKKTHKELKMEKNELIKKLERIEQAHGGNNIEIEDIKYRINNINNIKNEI